MYLNSTLTRSEKREHAKRRIKQMKSNSKEVTNKVKEHIANFIDYTEYENAKSIEQALRLQINAIKCYQCPTDYTAAVEMVKNGMFEVYTSDINAFMESLELNNNSSRKFSDDENFKKYQHLIALQVEKMIKAV